ncbi:ferredoxin [Rhodococcus sp. 14-2470-1a]|uniref:ferredoxin n=1 Tax=Rhodococcus sp. 14-2470-1a TaxID=2023150 RepID=UPI000B9ABAD9|nr:MULTISPECIES: ferredoxin [unclassified Rhodococcus (in: high G+C Gram-positive bacteria)]OZD59822.1 hypothetical protein CH263_22285 [Rhodococcus sp. 06-1059B-a]OZF56631.1 hypothetical protein CH292_03090 [Rhodococcus sp. 14-2470-1a]
MTRPQRRIHADRERCVGSGACAFTEPDVFDQDEEDGRVVVLDPAPADNLRSSVIDAVRGCPVSALEYIDADSDRDEVRTP